MNIWAWNINKYTIFFLLFLLVLSFGGIFWFFGPMKESHYQCLLCHRERVKKTKCGFQLYDTVKSNKYSNWIDTFYSKNHEHKWVRCTTKYRRWYGGTGIACGGIATIPRIYEQRKKIGRQNAFKLVQKFHQIVKQNKLHSHEILRDFTEHVEHHTKKLLEK